MAPPKIIVFPCSQFTRTTGKTHVSGVKRGFNDESGGDSPDRSPRNHAETMNSQNTEGDHPEDGRFSCGWSFVGVDFCGERGVVHIRPKNLTWNMKMMGFPKESPFPRPDFQVPC